MKRLGALSLVAVCLALCNTHASAQIGAQFVIGRHPDTTAYGGVTISPSGQRVPSPNSSIVDASLNTWTLGTGTTPNIQILRNGVQWAGGFGAQILWYQAVLYVQGDDLKWYTITATGYLDFGSSDPESGTPPLACSPCPVVPGGAGYGMFTRAAYGGSVNPDVLRVTTLNDDGPGSLRVALLAAGPRVVVFELSGTIQLNSDINVVSPYLTIAGQTAPSPGITVMGAAGASVSAGGILFHTHDILMQHIRIRPGDGGPVLFSTSGHEATDIFDGGFFPGGGGTYNIVFDHCSLSWAAAKLTTVFSIQTNAQISFWKNIFSEALFRAKNVTDDWAAGDRISSINMALGSSDAVGYGITVFGNLFAHNADRNPELGSGISAHIINNVIYDWGKDPALGVAWGTFLYTPDGTHIWTSDIIGNVYIAGPGTGPFATYYAVGVYSGVSGSSFYLNDNVTDSTVNPVTLLDDHTTYRVFSPALSEAGFTVLAGSAAKAAVLAHSGARPLDRDAVDTRIVTEVTNRTAMNGASCPTLPLSSARVASIPGRICSQQDVGGWPTLASNVRTFTTPASPHANSGNGYTNLEVTLQTAASALE